LQMEWDKAWNLSSPTVGSSISAFELMVSSGPAWKLRPLRTQELAGLCHLDSRPGWFCAKHQSFAEQQSTKSISTHINVCTYPSGFVHVLDVFELNKAHASQISWHVQYQWSAGTSELYHIITLTNIMLHSWSYGYTHDCTPPSIQGGPSFQEQLRVGCRSGWPLRSHGSTV
jgi:hypothetical protein